MEKRSLFSSKIGFVLAAAGSAVGLGNIWRFPYLAAKYGGGIFLLVYIILVLTFGFTLMVTEIALGRKTGLSVIGAYRALNKKWAFLGVLSAVVPIIIVPYYSVIGGWVTKYFADFISGAGTATAGDGYFNAFVSSEWTPLFWFAVFIAATFVIVFMGVEKGIEKASKILMPVLIGLTVAITIYSLTLPGAGAGVAYYFMPDFSKFSAETVLAAMGQMFYSMSLAMGIMVTYGSYMNKKQDLEQSVKQIEIFDTGVAILAGLMIVPAVFVFSGGDEAALSTGPSLMFQTMPKVFGSMGEAGNIVGAAFFLMVLFAALTSSISLMETVVSIFKDKFKISRKRSCFISLAIIVALAIPSSLGFGMWDHITWNGMTILDMFDFTSNSVIMPIVAMLTCIFVGYVIKPKAIIGEVELSSQFKRRKMYRVFIKYIAPFIMAAILICSVLQGIGVMPAF
ncbi:sodium-dependent transporter [Christensenella massiliensis]|uniref:Transporter n=1 Tax=Christensenella massiliensis TaxID=1805714 RepID=A0AAU8AAE8_9FIRM